MAHHYFSAFEQASSSNSLDSEHLLNELCYLLHVDSHWRLVQAVIGLQTRQHAQEEKVKTYATQVAKLQAQVATLTRDLNAKVSLPLSEVATLGPGDQAPVQRGPQSSDQSCPWEDLGLGEEGVALS